MVLLALFGTTMSVNYSVEVKVVKNSMVLQVEESERQPSHLEQKIGLEQRAVPNHTTKLSQQQIHEMMEVIEEIRLKGYKVTL
ncbi:hypothetical protein [Lysinibacillus cavernae]|uniref:hypothetical protein n=1 Tax=Lysinibacillus cavernae TaxID=2666135 RepID=UPI001E4B5892|nr:hypothetical protein [Lysinibacillus cavernae]